jgi:DUF4097 and DUF4098 domain-containing protein YvlB
MNHHRLTESVRAVARFSMIHALLAVALASAASAASAEEKNLNRTFNVTPGGLLTVDADGADIAVSGGDGNTVVVRIEARGSQSELDELTLSAEQVSDGIRVEARRPNQRGWFKWGSWRVETHIDVTVPRNYRLDAKTSGGEVRVEDLAGQSRVRTSGGNLFARNLKGDFEGYTSGGEVRIESMEGSVNAHTSGGNVLVSKVKGDVDANTSGGDVRVVGVDGRIRAGTSGGTVRCELTGQNRGISATTSGGSIWLTLPKDVKGTLDAQSSGGHIDSDFPISTTRWSEHRLNGEINGGGEEIHVRTSGGSITLSTAR